MSGGEGEFDGQSPYLCVLFHALLNRYGFRFAHPDSHEK